jgi:cell division septal protein FtsQ
MRKVLVASLTLFVIFGGGYLYFSTYLFSITTYDIRGVDDTYKSAIESALREESTKPFLYIAKHDKIASWSARAIRERITTVLPNVRSVTIYPTGMHTLRVIVTSHTPLYRVSDVQAITEEGIIYTEIHPIDSLPLLVIASSTTYDVVRAGVTHTYVREANKEFLQGIMLLTKKIESVLFPIQRIELDTYEDVTLVNEHGGVIKITKRAQVDKVWGSILSAIDTDPLKSKIADNVSALEYIDARFPNKVFYKFKGEAFTNKSGGAIIPTYEATTTPQ